MDFDTKTVAPRATLVMATHSNIWITLPASVQRGRRRSGNILSLKISPAPILIYLSL